MSLLERLDELYKEFGYYEEKGISKYFEGPSGMGIMQGIMTAYRTNQPIAFGGIPVVAIRDFSSLKAWHTSETKVEKLDFPSSDVLQWRLRDGTLVTVRPSGTEPKIKYYILCRTEVSSGGLESARNQTRDKIHAISSDIRKVIG
jgi:phosphoglucomutase